MIHCELVARRAARAGSAQGWGARLGPAPLRNHMHPFERGASCEGRGIFAPEIRSGRGPQPDSFWESHSH